MQTTGFSPSRRGEEKVSRAVPESSIHTFLINRLCVPVSQDYTLILDDLMGVEVEPSRDVFPALPVEDRGMGSVDSGGVSQCFSVL